jgi:hypothetical protein
MDELWIEIPETDGRYSISNFGSVRANWSDRPDRNLKHRVRYEKVYFLKPWVHTNGYWRVSLGRNNPKYVHRLIALAFLPNPDGLPQVDHIDGNRLNLSLENLQWVSAKQNMLLGSERHQWQSQKQASQKRRLFVENSIEFDSLYKAGYSLRWIARKFGTDHKLVRSRIDQFHAQSR